MLVATDVLSSYTNGEQFRVKVRDPCKSSCVVNLIMCMRCGQQFVGKTRQSLHYKINSHRFGIMHRRTEVSHVVAHFNNYTHLEANMTVMVIDQVYNHNPFLQKIQEGR